MRLLLRQLPCEPRGFCTDDILQALPDAVLLVDGNGVIRFANTAAETLLGQPVQALLGRMLGQPVEVAHPQELSVFSPDGEERVLEMVARAIEIAGEAMHVLSLRDATHTARHRDEMFHGTLTDELTGVYNRRGLRFLANQLMRVHARAPKQFCVLLLDLDDLKIINDTYGHPVGDEAIVAAATIMRESLRGTDILARIGGDEFVAIAEGVDERIFPTVWARINDHLKAYNDRADLPFALRFSIGAAFYKPDAPRSIEELLHDADRAMYRMKSANGRTPRRNFALVDSAGTTDPASSHGTR